MKKEKISVIVPTYKRPDKLKRSIKSILNQTYSNIQIVIVDDNTPGTNFRKKTINVLKKFKDYSNIKYIKHKKNMGGAIARNTGIKNSDGEYISFLDDDDEYYPKKIEREHELFKKSKINNLGFVYCQVNFYTNNKYKKMRKKVEVRGNENAIKKHMIRNLAPTSALLIKKKVFDKTGLFKNLKTGHEYELILRILGAGFNTDYVDKPLVNMHFHRQKRISTGKKKIKGEIELFEYKKKYFKYLEEKEIQKVKYLHYIDIYKRARKSKNDEIAKKYKSKINKSKYKCKLYRLIELFIINIDYFFRN